MSEPVAPPPLSRPIRIDQIETHGSGDIEVTQPEMETIAALLDLGALSGLRFSYRLRHRSGGRVHLAGRLNAHVGQTCVVTLEPVETDLDVPVELEFWPEAKLETLNEPDEPGGADPLEWPEPIRDGVIDLGPVVYETLGTSLDPYPRKQGASFEWSHDGEEASKQAPAIGPFAALERLKRG